MYAPFDAMPGHTRLWIYQASRPLTSVEKERIQAGLRNLCDGWMAHGTPLHTSYDIQFDQFIILAVDEETSGVSGCSIDGSVRHLKGLQEAGLDFFDRSKVAFLTDKGTVATYRLADLKTLLEKGTLSPNAITFNNLVLTKSEWKDHWRVPLKSSWLADHLSKTEVVK